MLTFEEVCNLQHGTILYSTVDKNKDGTALRWKVNGKVKRWKRDPNRVEVPVKYGYHGIGQKVFQVPTAFNTSYRNNFKFFSLKE